MIFRKDNNGLLYKINVKNEDDFLKAQSKGTLEYLKVEADELPQIDERFRTHFYKVKSGQIVPDETRIKEAWVEKIKKGIEKHIYSFYSEKKQSQDTKWADSYTTKLKASGVEDLELKIVNKAKAFFLGGTLEEMLEDVDDTQKPYFKKLIKVAIRTEWAELCVMEGKKAIQEDREPNYPPFPNI